MSTGHSCEANVHNTIILSTVIHFFLSVYLIAWLNEHILEWPCLDMICAHWWPDKHWWDKPDEKPSLTWLITFLFIECSNYQATSDITGNIFTLYITALGFDMSNAFHSYQYVQWKYSWSKILKSMFNFCNALQQHLGINFLFKANWLNIIWNCWLLNHCIM